MTHLNSCRDDLGAAKQLRLERFPMTLQMTAGIPRRQSHLLVVLYNPHGRQRSGAWSSFTFKYCVQHAGEEESQSMKNALKGLLKGRNF